ncbi:MAG TPA: Rieske 2Fe-2S domain-containing protein [Candidatus Dormibacteraeota bacterium]
MSVEQNNSGFDRWIEKQGWLDPPAEVVQGWVLKLYEAMGGPGAILKSMMHGTKPVGHPLHPALIAVPLGAFTVMLLADWLAIFTRAIPSEVGPFSLIVGILGMLAAAVTGYTDYTGTAGKERRYATVHGATMTLLLVAMIVSLALRYGHSATLFFTGVLVSTAAYLVMLWGAYLGGHLSFGFGTMVNRNAFVEGVTEWTEVGTVKKFVEGRLVRVQAGDMPVLLVRLGGRLNAIAATCSHAGGPLEEGTLEGDIVTCPWHGSRFCVSDGRVENGPATFDEPAFLVREHGGKVEVRLPAPLH